MNVHPKTITVLTSLTGAGAEDPTFFEPHGCLQSVMAPGSAGIIQHVLLGSKGVQVRMHERWLVIPLRLIMELAAQVDPAFKVPSPEELAAARSANLKLLQHAGVEVPEAL